MMIDIAGAIAIASHFIVLMCWRFSDVRHQIAVVMINSVCLTVIRSKLKKEKKLEYCVNIDKAQKMNKSIE